MKMYSLFSTWMYFVSAALAGSGLFVDKTPQSIYCTGDSMTVHWPYFLGQELDREVFTSAIGGTTSSAQKNRTHGVYLDYPVAGTDTILPGVIEIKLLRPASKHYNNATTYGSQIAGEAARILTPDKVMVTNNGRFIGWAKHNTIEVTTDYGSDTKALTKASHGLSDGDRVALWIDDPDRPSIEEVQGQDPLTAWQSPLRPGAGNAVTNQIVEYKVYFVANATTDTFELKFASGDLDTIDIGSDASGTLVCETGWSKKWYYRGGAWDIGFISHMEFDDRIYVIQTTTNDAYSNFWSITVPNINDQVATIKKHPKRVLYVLPSLLHTATQPLQQENWDHIKDTVKPWAEGNFGADRVIDPYDETVLGPLRTAKELGFLSDPQVAELLWLTGNPEVESTWTASTTDPGGAYQKWVGPGFLPLQFRKGPTFSDSGHYNDGAGAQYIANLVADKIEELGW